jgi:hypothetical protein
MGRQTLKTMSQAVDVVSLLTRFQAISIPTLVIKGQALSALAYGDWTSRGVSADLDLLIRAESLLAVHRVMCDLEYSCGADRHGDAPLYGWRGKYNFLVALRTVVPQNWQIGS